MWLGKVDGKRKREVDELRLECETKEFAWRKEMEGASYDAKPISKGSR